MWLLWRSLGTEGYYAGLDKQFRSLQQNIKTLEDGKQRRDQVWNNIRSRFTAGFFAIYMIILAYAAWVMQQPPGKYSSISHAKRVAPVFIAPIMAFGVYRVADKLRSLFDRRADAQIKSLKQKLTKMISELKDSTRYQRTQALIEKYDPEHQQKLVMAPRGGSRGNTYITTAEQQYKPGSDAPGSTMNGRGLVPSSSGRKLADRATLAAATAVSGAGAALSSALGQLVSSAANTLIADDPMVVGMLQQAQGQAKELEAENAELRRLLGWPPRGGPPSMANPGSGVAGGGSGPIEFSFGSPVSHNPDPDALIESPRALSPPQSRPSGRKGEKVNISNNGGGVVLEKTVEEEEDGDGDIGEGGTAPAVIEGNGVVRRRSRKGAV